MNPISPVISEEFQDKEVQIAKDQPEYNVLPSIIRADNKVRLSRWTFTKEEREAVAEGADIFLWVYCGFQPPVLLEAGECSRDLMDKAKFMWLVDHPSCENCGGVLNYALNGVLQSKCYDCSRRDQP